jgi:hypothetical protein
MAGDEGQQWYWCMRHNRAESTDRCGAELRMGPYPTKAEAENFAEKAQAREDAWEEEDDRWKNG